jgi:hypothetical protein
MKKFLNLAALSVLAVALICGLAGNSTLKALGWASMGGYDPIVHGVPETANLFLWAGAVVWPVGMLLALGLLLLARIMPAAQS